MANQYGIVIPVAILGFLIPSSECVTSLNCGSSVATVNLNQVYDTYTYPSSGSYPTLTTCQWLFQSSDSSSRITFTVTNIYIHCGDVLKFYDGTSDSASAIGSSVCCSAPCGASKAAETTTGNSFFVKFVTDGTTTTHETGFNVSVVVGKDESSCATNGTNNAVTLTAQTALTSPQFPANYPVSHICTYTYTYSGGTVRLEFVYLNVELDSGICYDYVELYNGSSTSSPLIAKVCGDTVPTTIYISTGSALTVKFLSDDQQTKTGFYANVIPVDAESTTSSDATTESSTIETTTNEPTSQSTTTEETSTSGTTSLSTTAGETSTSRTTTLSTTDGETSTSGTTSLSTTAGETSTSGTTSLSTTAGETSTSRTTTLSTTDGETSTSGTTSLSTTAGESSTSGTTTLSTTDGETSTSRTTTLSTTDGETSTSGTTSLSTTAGETSTSGTASLSTTDGETSTSGTTSLSTTDGETTTTGPRSQATTARETTTIEFTSQSTTAEETTNGPTTQSTTAEVVFLETTNGPTTQSTTAEAQSDHPEYTTRFVRKVFVYGNNGVGLASTSENTDDGGVIAAIVVSVLAVVLLMGVGIVLYRKKVKGRYPVDTVKESVPKNDGDDMQEKNTKDIIDESEMESKASPPSSTAIHSDTMKI
ncbi:mucin-22-like isoform X4 [Ostrea edulis]|uniref:mucin-22-like isoform X4 n=1 Tax=Ostrea edulis TaxID=37623 RepID=UPI0024AEEF47|nr:mucin-22-like isoform X4 [Ostrea edulis]